MLSILLTIACWAPEVKAPEPKLSPRERAAQEEGTEFQPASQDTDSFPKAESPPTDSDIQASKNTEDTETTEAVMQNPELQPTEENPIAEENATEKSAGPEKKEPPRNYPYSTKTKEEIPLLGRGGGQIMLIPAGSTIDVLEKKETGLHIICQDCAPNRPRQAGFIALDAI